MKRIHTNLKKGEIKLEIENPDDLWYLSQVIEPTDIVLGKTIRKIKIGGEEQRTSNVIKKPVFLSIKVEKVEFGAMSDTLRVSGTILEGPDDIPHGTYHTFNIEHGTVITIIKEHWYQYQLEKIEEASKGKETKVLIILMDREEAYFAKLKTQKSEIISKIKGDVQKKGNDKSVHKEFFPEIAKMIIEYDERLSFSHIIIASPSFWKEDLLALIKNDKIRQKTILATASSVSEAGINELLRRPEVQTVLKEERIADEIKIVEEVLYNISKNLPVAYGVVEVKKAADAGAIKILTVVDKFIFEMKEQGKFIELDQIMRTAEKNKAEIHVISGEHEGGKKLAGIGGIAAILRYAI